MASPLALEIGSFVINEPASSTDEDGFRLSTLPEYNTN